MSRLPLNDEVVRERFPGMDVLGQSDHWDRATSSVVAARLGPPPDIRFFTEHEEATATALCDQLLGQHAEPRIPVVHLIDARLAERETDGWHYEDMPADYEAWRETLAALDAESRECWAGADFAQTSLENQAAVLQAVRDRGAQDWHGWPAKQVWSLWTRYACAAFYSHPWAWDEIGFPGPAYPRGYKNIGVDKREPFEVADARPVDPTRLTTRLGMDTDA